MVAPSTQRMLASLADMAALNIGTGVSAAHVKSAFNKASIALKSKDDSDLLTLQLAVTERLGQYTAEQEADEEAAEWVAETGLEPKHVVEAMRNLGKGSPTSMRGMILGEEDCDTLRASAWHNSDGSYAFVPVGDFSEVHHSVCYRMFNLEREIDAHSHEPASISAPTLTATQWADLQHKADHQARQDAEDCAHEHADAHLRSTKEVTGYGISATDDHLGHVTDFIVNDETWRISYLTVDTQNWWPGKSILLPPEWITRVNWSERSVSVNVTRDQVKGAPEWEAEKIISHAFETQLYAYYDRQHPEETKKN